MWKQSKQFFTSSERADVRRFSRMVAMFFLLPTICYLPFGYLFSEAIVERARGPSMKKQIFNSFKNAKHRDYELLILGNSRMYRGLNPDIFSIPTYNFSHDNDTYNQSYHKLKWLSDQGKSFKILLLGVDYFQFGFLSDGANHVYGKLLGESYLADYPEHPFFSKKRWIEPGTIRGMNPAFLFASTEGRIIQKPNGQMTVNGKASPLDSVNRNANRLPLQVEYFEKILALCENRSVPVVMCMMPIRPAEARAYKDGEMEEFHEFLSTYVNDTDRILIDHTNLPGFGLKDFTDITHLNAAAGDRYSTKLNSEVMQKVATLPPVARIAERMSEQAHSK